MSHVLLLAADKPLPLCNCQSERATTLPGGGTISFVRGFRVEEHRYYRPATDALGWVTKPFQYELELEEHPDDLAHLRSYLREQLAPGQEVELWSLWVGDDETTRPLRCRGSLSDFDIDTLNQLLTQWPLCLTVTTNSP